MKKGKIKVFLSILTTVFIFSCAGVKVDPNDPNAHLIQGVKQVYQGPMQCAAACLTMVLRYYNVDASMNKIDSKIRYGSGGVGCWPLEAYASRDFRTESFIASDVEKLKEYISKEIPLIARVHSESRPGGCHYVVLVGYTGKGFIINDPIRGRRFKSYQAFQKWHSCSFFGCGPYWILAIYR